MTSREQAIAALREETEARWDDLREQRVLAELRRRNRVGSVKPPPWRRGALAFALVAAIAALWPLLAGTPQTRTAWVLEDGSEVTLEDGARVEVEVSTPLLLRVVQRRGRAQYAVTRNPERAFEVVTERATVRVRGTVFEVTVLDDATEVSVSEGCVEVQDDARAVLLGPGETIRVVDSARPPTLAAPEEPSLDEHVEDDPHEVTALPEETPPEREPVVDAATLEARAINARRAGRIDQAASLFARAEQRAADPEERARLAFTLGRVESMRGRTRAAAQAFERCARADTSGALAEDATASAAEAWFGVGEDARGRATAVRYLQRWPTGLHATGMRLLANE
jgi:transmembrane sensor